MRVLEDGRVFIDYGPASMVVTARRDGENLHGLIKDAFPVLQAALAEIADSLPVLRLPPDKIRARSLTGLARVMTEAALATGEPSLTPMATVAGTVADCVADWLFSRGADLVLVNNGGDVAIRLDVGQSLRMGILPDQDKGTVTQVVEIRAGDGIGGVCTSGLGGRSLTRGIANSVTVFSSRCAAADACATHIANCTYIDSPAVKTAIAGEIEPDSDIAHLSVVTSVGRLTEEEKLRALSQAEGEARIQMEKGNLLYMAADVQGHRCWIPQYIR